MASSDTNRKVVLYIAMSLDGYIATEDDNIDFLSMVESPGEDYGYSEFIQTVDTVIMGRKTYDKVLSFGIEFPHADKKCYVLSRNKKGRDANVEFWNKPVDELIRELKTTKGKHIYIDGGSEMVQECMKKSLIDTYVLSIIPCLLGGGIRLFKEGFPQQNLKLISSTSFSSGLVQLQYSYGF